MASRLAGIVKGCAASGTTRSPLRMRWSSARPCHVGPKIACRGPNSPSEASAAMWKRRRTLRGLIGTAMRSGRGTRRHGRRLRQPHDDGARLAGRRVVGVDGEQRAGAGGHDEARLHQPLDVEQDRRRRVDVRHRRADASSITTRRRSSATQPASVSRRGRDAAPASRRLSSPSLSSWSSLSSSADRRRSRMVASVDAAAVLALSAACFALACCTNRSASARSSLRRAFSRSSAFVSS